MSRIPVLVTLALLMVTPLACSFSDSSNSLSQSISSPITSWSSSSGGAAERTYQADVRDYTQAFVTSGNDFRTFQSDLGQLAKKHGVTNWEENMATYVGIGEGLGKAKVNPSQLKAYQRNLGGSDQRKMDAIQQGYDSTR